MQHRYFTFDSSTDTVDEVDAATYHAWRFGPGDEERRRVALDTVGSRVVSTVFTGWLGDSPESKEPVLFETLVFVAGKRIETDGEQYATVAEARAGHKRIVDELRSQVS